MEDFTEVRSPNTVPSSHVQIIIQEHSKQLLNSEWLVKVDSIKATPYLFKYIVSLSDLSCCILFTDTKRVWVEVLNSKTLARRWRGLNSQLPPSHEKASDEDTWREQILELLSNAHTMGGIIDLSFEVVDSIYSDMAFDIECQAFKWKWETCFIGHQRSSEIISKHLIFPLISFGHLAFSSAEPVSELTDSDLEKSVDKLARTARRTVDNHVKNALSKPRFTTSIRRMTAMFNFLPDLKPVVSVAEVPLLEVPKYENPAAPSTSFKPPVQERDLTVPPQSVLPGSGSVKTSHKRSRSPDPEPKPEPSRPPPVADSETETETEDESAKPKNESKSTISSVPSSTPEPSRQSNMSRDQTSLPQKSQSPPSSSPRPTKKAKSSTDGSDSETDKKGSRSNSTAPRHPVPRGTRQPIKRGGKRF